MIKWQFDEFDEFVEYVLEYAAKLVIRRLNVVVRLICRAYCS
jgi:hypothetical protein